MNGFSGPLDLRAYEPGEWVTLTAVQYQPWHGCRLLIPAGFITDLASVPRLLQPMISVDDATRQPAVLHDWLYCNQSVCRARADALLLEALQRAGVSRVKAWVMYAGVRAGGWLYWRRHRGGLSAEDMVGDDFWDTGEME